MQGDYARETVEEKYLTAFERTEIIEFDEVWYLASAANKN